MKKMITIILMCLLAGNISGAGISYHYCGDLLQSLSIDFKTPKTKCCCGDAHKNQKASGKKKSCCDTKHKKVSVDKSKTFAKHLFVKRLVEAGPAVLPTFYGVPDNTGNAIAMQAAIPLPLSPPFLRCVPIHILHQQFLI